MVIWITGISGSGKSTFGKFFFRKFKKIKKNTIFFDGDEFRKILLDDIKELQNYSFEFGSLYLHAAYGHLQWLLTKWDKASMSSSVEIRSPFMDWKFFQYYSPWSSYRRFC